MIVKLISKAKTVEIEYLDEMTVADLKLIAADMMELDDTDPQSMRLCNDAGLWLERENDTVASYNVSDNSTLYLKLLSDETETTNPSTSSSNSAPAAVPQMLDSSLLQHMIFSNPGMQKMFDKNPELRHALADPSMMKQMLDAASDPDKMLQLQKSNDLALAHLENMPGGFQALTGIYRDIEDSFEHRNPLLNDTSEQQEERNRLLAQSLGVGNIPSDRINDLPLPNPWSPPPLQQPAIHRSHLPSLSLPQNHAPNIFRGLSSNHPAGSQQQVATDFRSRYREQLQAMNDMGFVNEEVNLGALISCNGDVDAAIAFILSRN